MQTEEEGDKKVSKFTGALAQIYRIDGLWRDVNSHSRNGLFEKWNMDLDRMWSELSRDLSDEEFTIYEEKFDNFDDDLSKFKEFYDNEPEGFKVADKNAKENRAKIYRILMNKELFLRRLENHVGKGTSFEDSDEYDID